MIVSFPTPPQNYTPQALVQVLDTIRRALIPVVATDQAANRILLQSPNGTVYEVTVDNSGNLHTAVNSGKTRI